MLSAPLHRYGRVPGASESRRGKASGRGLLPGRVEGAQPGRSEGGGAGMTAHLSSGAGGYCRQGAEKQDARASLDDRMRELQGA